MYLVIYKIYLYIQYASRNLAALLQTLLFLGMLAFMFYVSSAFGFLGSIKNQEGCNPVVRKNV